MASLEAVKASRSFPRKPWQLALGLAWVGWLSAMAFTLVADKPNPTHLDAIGWAAFVILHLPYALIVLLLTFGLVDRFGYLFAARRAALPGTLPPECPSVCVQLPMFNEHAVAERVIEAAAALNWPRGRLHVQVLDDSTDPIIRKHVEAVCTAIRERTGVRCTVLHRENRAGYKAGALEAGRRQTDAEFIAIFDADFVPPPDFLQRAIPHFFNADGMPTADLALVQAQWGHLNDEQTFLTGAQALWVDDHHTLQQSWRSAAVGFVNFTGTAGVWRASAIEAVGGWRSASLVEDCELSVRALFHGYRTKFVKEIVAPAELPQTFTDYRLQQKRWTQGWVQLQRLHLMTLLTRFHAPLARKAYLTYMLCTSWQWPLWFIWITVLPFLIAHGLWFGAYGIAEGLLVYLGPPILFTLLAGLIATVETHETYRGRPGNRWFGKMRRLGRIWSQLVVNAGMLPHHASAFIEGLFGPMHSEFERTPKTAAVSGAISHGAPSTPKPLRPQRRVPYLALELTLVVTQAAWTVYFATEGLVSSAAWAGWLVVCVAAIRIAPLLSAALERFSPPAQSKES